MAATIEQKPLPVKLVNAGYRLAKFVGIEPIKLDKTVLMGKAIKAANGLNDFGDPRFEEGLDQLLNSINRRNELNGFGRVMASQHIVQLLRHRLNMTHHLKANPAILDEPIEKPIFIIGAPRTGTTITHHLMSQDKRLRYPYTWECFEIYPPLDPKTLNRDPRIELSRKDCDRIKKLAPNIEAAHPIGPWEAQECALFMALEFASETFPVMFNCQEYSHWLAEQDLTWVYEQHKVTLQYMQSGGLRPSEAWLLKTPPHMSKIDHILKVYPDARFITTYREPTDVVLSSCSLVSTMVQMAQNEVDWGEIGAHMTNNLEREMRKNVELRQQYADRPELFIDFPMQEMVKDPVSCVKAIYRHFNIEMTADVAKAIDRYMEIHALKNRIPHHYTPEEFNLDLDEMWPRFQFYRDFYHIGS